MEQECSAMHRTEKGICFTEITYVYYFSIYTYVIQCRLMDVETRRMRNKATSIIYKPTDISHFLLGNTYNIDLHINCQLRTSAFTIFR